MMTKQQDRQFRQLVRQGGDQHFPSYDDPQVHVTVTVDDEMRTAVFKLPNNGTEMLGGPAIDVYIDGANLMDIWVINPAEDAA